MAGVVRRLVLGVEIKPGGKRCACYRDDRHLIFKGQLRFVVKNAGGPGEKGYCAACGKTMVEAARRRLNELDAALVNRPGSDGVLMAIRTRRFSE